MTDELVAERQPYESIPNWVWQHKDVTAGAVHLYLLLRHRANANGVSWWSLERMGDDLGVSRDTVRRNVKVLEAIGAVTVTPFATDTGRQQSNRYTVRWTQAVAVADLPPVADLLPLGVAEVLHPGVAEMPHELTHIELTHRNSHTSVADGFDEFWSAYPRKAEKQAARKAYDKAVKQVGPQAVLEGAIRYAADPNRDDAYTKHAATWLNKGCWDDPPLPPRVTGVDRRMTEAQGLLERARARDAAERKAVGS